MFSRFAEALCAIGRSPSVACNAWNKFAELIWTTGYMAGERCDGTEARKWMKKGHQLIETVEVCFR